MNSCLHFFHWFMIGSALLLAGAVAQTAVPLPELRRAGNVTGVAEMETAVGAPLGRTEGPPKLFSTFSPLHQTPAQ